MSAFEEDDGLSSFDMRQLGGKVGAFGGAKILKFVQGDFITREGEKIGLEREFITFGLIKAVQKFVNKQLIDTKIVAPHADFPDIAAMNEAAPKDEWGIGLNGQPQGPLRTADLEVRRCQDLRPLRFCHQQPGRWSSRSET